MTEQKRWIKFTKRGKQLEGYFNCVYSKIYMEEIVALPTEEITYQESRFNDWKANKFVQVNIIELQDWKWFKLVCRLLHYPDQRSWGNVLVTTGLKTVNSDKSKFAVDCIHETLLLSKVDFLIPPILTKKSKVVYLYFPLL